jgi:tRNA (adenine57-N1/adenine58-N1)-methyltransferase
MTIGKIMLLGKRNFLVDAKQKKLNTEFGLIDLAKVKKYGQIVKTSTGEKFIAAKPTIKDLLSKCKRIPQIITTKDAGQIIAATGLHSDWNCMDLGGGSGFLSIFLANFLTEGSIVAYEKDTRHAKNIVDNVKFCGLEKIITVKNKPAEKFTERNLDLITTDFVNAEKSVKKCFAALKPGGWLVMYSPQIEQHQKAKKEINKMNFDYMKTVETIQREWKIDPRGQGFTHPVHTQLVHTGFMTFARKKM